MHCIKLTYKASTNIFSLMLPLLSFLSLRDRPVPHMWLHSNFSLSLCCSPKFPFPTNASTCKQTIIQFSIKNSLIIPTIYILLFRKVIAYICRLHNLFYFICFYFRSVRFCFPERPSLKDGGPDYTVYLSPQPSPALLQRRLWNGYVPMHTIRISVSHTLILYILVYSRYFSTQTPRNLWT